MGKEVWVGIWLNFCITACRHWYILQILQGIPPNNAYVSYDSEVKNLNSYTQTVRLQKFEETNVKIIIEYKIDIILIISFILKSNVLS